MKRQLAGHTEKMTCNYWSLTIVCSTAEPHLMQKLQMPTMNYFLYIFSIPK